MKLTADDISIIHEDCPMPHILITSIKTWEEAEKLKKEILDNQEKADRGEELLIIYKDMRKTVFELEQQIKELKEKLSRRSAYYDDLSEQNEGMMEEYLQMVKENQKLKEKSDKWDKFNDDVQGNLALCFKKLNEKEQENKRLKEVCKQYSKLLKGMNELNDKLVKENQKNEEIVEKIRTRLPILIQDEKELSKHGEPTDNLRSEIQFYKELLGESG